MDRTAPCNSAARSSSEAAKTEEAMLLCIASFFRKASQQPSPDPGLLNLPLGAKLSQIHRARQRIERSDPEIV